MNVALISLATLPLTAMANFQWRPILPPQQIVFITVLMLALAVYAYMRHFRRHRLTRLALLLMRWMGILVVATLMMGPSATPLSRVKKQDSELVVLLDCSESMATEDCRDQSRIEVALKHWLNASFLNQLRDVASVRVAGFAEDSEQLDENEIMDPREMIRVGESTLLVETLSDQIYRRRYGSSTVLLLSDGHDSEEYSLDSAANVAVDAGVPVNTVSFGNASVGSDLSLLAVPRQDYLLPNEAGAILVKVYQSGLPQANTRLRIDGSNPREFPIEFNGQPQVELSVPIQEPEAGDYSYRLSVDSVEGEVETDNNSLQVYSQVQERRIRVLLLEGQPYWDTKFLAQSLRKDERLELVQITQVAPESRETLVSRSNAETVRVPSNEEEWAHYDVVVLGRQIQNILNEVDAARLSDFVIDHGGHLVFARGRPYDSDAREARGLGAALRRVEPVQWLDRELDLGAASSDVDMLGLETTWLAANKVTFETPEVLRELGGLTSIDLVRRLKPATRVIMQANERGEHHPLLVTMPAGRGNVVGLLGSGSWRWSLRAPKASDATSRRDEPNGDSRKADALVGFYDTFWSNMIRWLVLGGDFQPGQQASLRVSQQAARVQDGVTINVGFKEASGIDGDWRVTLRTTAGDERQLMLSRMPGRAPRFQTHLSLAAGSYEVQLETPGLEPPTQTRRFTMYDVNPERLDASAWPEQLRHLAERTGGQHFKIDDADRFLKSLRQASVANQVPEPPRYIWDEFWIMLLLLMWIGGEWVLRRMAGLI